MTTPCDRLDFYRLLNEGIGLQAYFECASCDVIVDANLAEDTFRRVYNAESKFFLPPEIRSFSELAAYMVNHLVHPDQAAKLKEVLNPAKLAERLAASPIPGFCFDHFLFRTRTGAYRTVEQVVLAGPRYGLPEGAFRFYGMDIHSLQLRKAGFDKDASVHVAESDELTGLPHERDFLRLASDLLDKDPEKHWCVAVMDIEHFRLYDEWFGRRQGDELLRRIGSLLHDFCAGNGGVPAYLMQDDFGCLLPYDKALIQKLYDDLHTVILSTGATVGFLPAIGICQVWDKRDLAVAMDKASVVAKDSKNDIRERIHYFDAAAYQREERDRQLILAFMRALRDGEVTFFLQPQCRISNGRIVGGEALARWRKSDGTYVSPGVFVPLLEKYNFIPVLDQYIWDKVCAWIRRWIDEGHKPVPISVNVSRLDVIAMDLPQVFGALIEKYHLDPKLLKIEITESSYIEFTEPIKDMVDRLHELGFKVWMDDFGSGYSSLNMLSSINIDAVKLDAAFLRLDGGAKDKGLHVLESIVAMTKNMGMPTITEGVETKEQRDFLENLGCRYVQGFYFYKGMPVEEFEALIRNDDNVDARGFVMKPNSQLRIRELVDRDLYSDSMLNSILGPVGFYYWDGKERVDITRFNQQFYEAVATENFEGRLENITQYMPPEDAPKLLAALKKATEDRLNGAETVGRFYRANGTLTSFSMHFYYLRPQGDGMRFYGAVRDSTPLIDATQKLGLLGEAVHATVLFCSRIHGKLTYQVAAHSLGGFLGVDADTLAHEFQTQTFSKGHIAEEAEREKVCHAMREAIAENKDTFLETKLKGADGTVLPASLDLRYVGDRANNVAFMLLIRLK